MVKPALGERIFVEDDGRLDPGVCGDLAYTAAQTAAATGVACSPEAVSLT